MTIKAKSFGSFGYTKRGIESPKLYGYKSKVNGLIVSPWGHGPYDFIIKVLKLNK